MIRTLLLLFVTLLSVPVRAAEPQLILPAACMPGQDCWVVNHVDMNPAPDKAEDFTCGKRTYEGHEGTDFGVRDLNAMKAGVSVLAAAPGKVLRVRDAMPDAQPSATEIASLLADNKGCGNGVLVDHGGGWQSIYCHLKAGSITVKPDDQVTVGQSIAQIGQSGAAEFPHLHFGLFFEGKTVDPFSGTFAMDGCGKIKNPMWLYGIHIEYEPLAIFAAGFSTVVPDFNHIRQDTSSPDKTTPAIDVLAFWVGLYGMRAGDQIMLRVTAPDGEIFAENKITQETDKSRQFYYVGRKIGDPLLPGLYRATATIERAIGLSSSEKLVRATEKTILIANPVDESQDGSGGVILP